MIAAIMGIMSAAITTPITIIITALMPIVIIATIIICQSEGVFLLMLKAFFSDVFISRLLFFDGYGGSESCLDGTTASGSTSSAFSTHHKSRNFIFSFV